jgi:hypothetical protein
VASASSRPTAGGISVTADPVLVFFKQRDRPTGIVTYDLRASATWQPDAVRTEGSFVIRNLTEGGVQRINFGSAGRELHSYESWEAPFTAFSGIGYQITARWRVYNPGFTEADIVEGRAESKARAFRTDPPEPAPRFLPSHKDQLFLAQLPLIAGGSAALVFGAVAFGTPIGAVLLVAAAVTAVVVFKMNRASRDPIDPNFRAVAKPKFAPAPKVSAGEGLSAAAAKALNDLFVLQVRESGLADAILTAFNRSQGAHVKKQTAWEKKQVRAAGRYAAQFAAALLAEAKLRPKVKALIAESASEPLSVSEEDAYRFEESWVRNGMPAPFTAVLAKLGIPRAQQPEVGARLIRDPSLNVGNPLNAIADQKLIGSLRRLAASLQAFSRKAAKDPLHTGT